MVSCAKEKYMQPKVMMPSININTASQNSPVHLLCRSLILLIIVLYPVCVQTSSHLEVFLVRMNQLSIVLLVTSSRPLLEINDICP